MDEIICRLSQDEIERQDWKQLTLSKRITLKFIEDTLGRFPWHIQMVVFRRDLDLGFIKRHSQRFGVNDADDVMISAMEIWSRTSETKYPPFIKTLDTQTAIRLFSTRFRGVVWKCNRNIADLMKEPEAMFYVGCIVQNPNITEDIIRILKPELQKHRYRVQCRNVSADYILKNKSIDWIDIWKHPEAIRISRALAPTQYRMHWNDKLRMYNHRNTRLIDVPEDIFPFRNPHLTMEYVLLNTSLMPPGICLDIPLDIADLYHIPAIHMQRNPNMTLEWFLEHRIEPWILTFCPKVD